jgi:hypothetical protein
MAFYSADIEMIISGWNTLYKLPLESDEHAAGFIKRVFHLMKQTLVEDSV